MKGFFITGTGTGVGKTIATIALGIFLKSHGFNTIAIKPIESGCALSNNQLIPHDGMMLKDMLRQNESIDRITPIRFESPLAPMVASEIEGKTIDIDFLLRHINEISLDYDNILIEGIGGIMVPILHDYFIYDLISDIALPVIIVANSGLGTINHTLLTVDLALRKGFTVAGVIINHCANDDNDLSIASNPQIIRRLCPVPVIGEIPYLYQVAFNRITVLAASSTPQRTQQYAYVVSSLPPCSTSERNLVLETLDYKDFEHASNYIDNILLKYL